MIELSAANPSEKIIVTLTERTTINEPFYLFVFRNVTTKDIVIIIYSSDDDESEYPQRYNQFEINMAAFAGKMFGHWNYAVYQQDNGENTDAESADILLEKGKMILYGANGFAFEMYEQPTTYKTYQG